MGTSFIVEYRSDLLLPTSPSDIHSLQASGSQGEIMARKLKNKHHPSGLAAARIALGMKQGELAQLLGVARSTIITWENMHHDRPVWLSLLCQGLYAYRIIPAIGEPLSGPALAEARQRLGVDQQLLGQKIGKSRNTISRWENDTPPKWLSFVLATLAFTTI